jgi:hypothetical protein
VENEDGDVLKKYDLPTQKPQQDLMAAGLKYMGMGVFAKAMDKSAGEASTAGETSAAAGEPSTQRQRKKSVVQAEEEEEDDKHIRFTIGGLGRRMTKEDFIQEMQKLDKNTRREVVNELKALGKPDGTPQFTIESPAQTSAKAASATDPTTHQPQEPAGSSQQASRSSSPGHPATSSETPSSEEAGETEVERRRRVAALQGVGDDNDDEDDDEDHAETAAERRRREAALGMAPHGDGDDSDDDDTPRVPPSKRSIRFADVPDRGRTRE